MEAANHAPQTSVRRAAADVTLPTKVHCSHYTVQSTQHGANSKFHSSQFKVQSARWRCRCWETEASSAGSSFLGSEVQLKFVQTLFEPTCPAPSCSSILIKSQWSLISHLVCRCIIKVHLEGDKYQVCLEQDAPHFGIIFLRGTEHSREALAHGRRLEKPRMDVTPLFPPPNLRTLMTCNVRPGDP